MSHEVQGFESQVVQRSRHTPVLVDFWAPWCAPCRALDPVLERLAAQAGGQWELVKVNTEEHQDLAATVNIASIPAVKFFVNGEVVNEFVGAPPEREIRRFLEQALPSPSAKQVTEAQRLLAEGSNAKAAELQEPIAKSDPGNLQARVLLAQFLLSSAPERIASLVDPVGAESEWADKAGPLRILARLAQWAEQPGILPEGKVRERYQAGVAAVRAGDLAAALAAFIEVLERNKECDNRGAKAACKSIFQLRGPCHPLANASFAPSAMRCIPKHGVGGPLPVSDGGACPAPEPIPVWCLGGSGHSRCLLSRRRRFDLRTASLGSCYRHQTVANPLDRASRIWHQPGSSPGEGAGNSHDGQCLKDLGPGESRRQKMELPWFILLFLLASFARSCFPAIARWAAPISAVARGGLAIALCLIGVSLSLSNLRSVGWKAPIQGTVLWVFISLLSLAVILHQQ